MNQVPAAASPNLSDLEFWRRPISERAAVFDDLRAGPRPLYYDLMLTEGSLVTDRRGFYVLPSFDEVTEASKSPEKFCSGKGATSTADLPQEFNDFFGSMINMDDPRHQRLRGLVSSAFTPRQMKRIEDSVVRLAGEILERVRPQGECDFVTEIAARFPLEIICEMMGVPEDRYDEVFHNSNIILGAADEEYVPDINKAEHEILSAGLALAELMNEISADRIDNPADDLTSALLHAEIDGERLTREELASFFILLLVAGNETTRNAISWGLHLLTENPEQKALWMADPEGRTAGAVEEIVRWASPVMFMRRTVAVPEAELGGATYVEGDKLMLHYWAANRDPLHFDRPNEFDITRDGPEPHVGFGAPGPHYCLGAHLARRELGVIFNEIFTRMPDLVATAQPDRLRSAFINGVKHLPCRWTP